MICRRVFALVYLLAPLAWFASSGMAAQAAGPDIPELNWEQRSDWINVKTAVQPPAKGDGVADDTAAIQAALNKMDAGTTIYFPPGTYRITKTLQSPEGRWLGVSLIGHGRTTTLAWDGEAGGRMFWTRDGMPCCRYVGLTWDGRNKAAVGFEHSCVKIFETEIRHQHEAYRNFTEAGIRAGHELKLATAETLYDNCLFENCKNGVLLQSFNVLDHTFDGCEFRHCGYGIFGSKGTNWYALDCHFEQNTESDTTFAGEAGSSLRRCTSHGSKQFATQTSSVATFVIEDCQVDAWTSPGGAVVLGGAPVLIFDTVFSHPPTSEGAVQITNPRQRLILSNNQPASQQVLKTTGVGRVYEIPAGAEKPVLKSASQSFLKRQVKIPGKVFDAKRDFGAKGDGTTDDTAAVLKAIEAARAHGNGAIAYLPAGRFAVKETLKLTGKDYFFGGSGYRTALVWAGKPGGTTIEISDPDHITLENMAVGHHDCGVGPNAVDIQQTGTGKPSFMTFDRVWVWGMYQAKPLERGLRMLNLGKQDQVLFREINGNLHFTDCAAATAYLRLSYEGTILAEGKSPARDGFLGGSVRLGTVTDPALWIKDNHSIVMSDLYVESSLHLLRMEGDPNLPAGRVTIQGAKYEISKPENNALEVNNYHGELVLGPYLYYPGDPVHRFVQQGTAPFDLTLLGGVFYNCKAEFKLAPTSKLSVVAAYSPVVNKDDSVTEMAQGVADVAVPEGMPHLTRSLDDLRRLGAVDAKLNHPE